MDEFKTYKDQSKRNWYNANNQTQVPLEDIQAGCLQRIADATEVIAKNYNNLIAERDMFKQLYCERRERVRVLEKKLSAKRGVITKLKNKITKTKSDEQV